MAADSQTRVLYAIIPTETASGGWKVFPEVAIDEMPEMRRSRHHHHRRSRRSPELHRRPEPNFHEKGIGDGAAGDLTIVRPAAAAPPRRPEQVEQVGRHRAAQPRARAREGSEYEQR
jgi:hypothetical protein